MDPDTVVTVLAAYAGSKEVVGKVLGPSADYVGEGLRTWTEKGAQNVGKIFAYASKKLGPKIDEEGGVPAKVFRDVVRDGPFVDDELTAEYFGGVLASSRSKTPSDDRGAVLTSLIGRLSTYQIRSHYFFYSLFKEVFNGEELTPASGDDRAQMQLFVSIPSYVSALESLTEENTLVIAQHVLFGLHRENLLADFTMAEVETLRSRYGDVLGGGIVLVPSATGVELFLWAHGRGEISVHDFLSKDLVFSTDTAMNFVPIFQRIKPPKHQNPNGATLDR